MRLKKMFFYLLAVVLLVSCKGQGTGSVLQYMCPDGTMVESVDSCPEPEPPPIDNRSMAPPVNRSNVGPLGEKIEPEREFTTLRRTEEKNETVGTLFVDLNGWSVQEIVLGMGSYNSKFWTGVPVNIRYDPANPEYYWRGSERNKKQDPFWITSHNYISGVKEYDINNFRVNLILKPFEFYDVVKSKHKDSKFKMLHPQEWAVWESIDCEKLNSCRNIEAIKCVRGDHTLYMWNHNAPGTGYTDKIRYTMSARDDGGETLRTFEEFYCTAI